MPVRRAGNLEDNLARYQRALPGALTAAGQVVVTRTRRVFVLFRPKGWATGRTVRSLTISPPFMDGGYMRVKVGPTTKYSWWLHFGRDPGKMPPVQAILDWVKEKHVGNPGDELSTAWAIAKSIGRKGTKPVPFLTVGFRQSKDDALRVFRRALMRGVASGR
jgi:hypothetical protein